MNRFIRLAFFCGLFLSASLAGAQGYVLAELFRNIDCTNCKQPDEEYEAFMASNPQYRVVPIFYHNHFPFSQDPFYLASQQYVDARAKGTGTYNIISDPTGVIDGLVTNERVTKWIDETKKTSADKEISVTLTPVKLEDGKIEVTMVATGSSPNPGRAFIAVVESGIPYENSRGYGNPKGLPIWDNVFRAMLPTKDGSEVMAFAGTKTITAVLDPSSFGGKAENLKFIGFVQDNNTQTGGRSRFIRGVGVATLPLSGVATSKQTAGFTIAPNPLSAKATLNFDLSRNAEVTIAIVDLSGRTLRNETFGMRSQGAQSLEFDRSDLPSGAAFLHVFVDGKLDRIEKIVVL